MTDYQDWLIGWFHQRAPEVELQIDDNYFITGVIDSLGVIELIEDIEKMFKVRFTENDFQDRRFSSVSGLAEILSEKITL